MKSLGHFPFLITIFLIGNTLYCNGNNVTETEKEAENQTMTVTESSLEATNTTYSYDDLPVVNGKVNLTKEEWKKRLTPEQYQITRESGTERAFSGKYYNTKKNGTYICACCGNELFSSDSKFDSGTGWPSFFQALGNDSVAIVADNSHGMKREEVQCNRCAAHLGHVFNDGPKPTGLRYCMNSASLNFIEN